MIFNMFVHDLVTHKLPVSPSGIEITPCAHGTLLLTDVTAR